MPHELELETAPLELNRVPLIVLVIAGIVIGTIPVPWFLDRWDIMFVVVPVAAMSVTFAHRDVLKECERHSSLSSLEACGIVLEANFWTWVASMAWLTLHGLVYLIVRISNELFDTAGDSSSIALWTAGSVAMLFNAFITYPLSAEFVGESLDQSGRSQQSAYTWRQRTQTVGWFSGVALVIGATGVAILLTGWTSLYAMIVGSVGQWFLGIFVTAAVEGDDEDEVVTIGPEARRFADVVSGLGYEAILKPHTNDHSVDPFITMVDIFALGPDAAMAIMVHPRGELEWTAGSQMLMAARALESVADGEYGQVTPVIVLMHGKPSDELTELALGTPLTLVRAGKRRTKVIGENELGETLRAAMERYLAKSGRLEDTTLEGTDGH